MSEGSEFQVVAAATEKARRGRSVLVLGATSSRASDDRLMMFDKLWGKGWSSSAHRTETVTTVDESRTVIGSEFHEVGPETAKLRCPYLVVLIAMRCISQVTSMYRTDANS